jgi:ABC-type phosphate transport system substrate-binding protein
MNKLIFSVLISLASTLALADPVVIANSGLQLQASDIKDVFSGTKQFAGAVKLVPVDNAQTQSSFLADVLKVTPTKYKQVWAKKAFQEGLTPPDVKSTDAEVLDYVKRTPGAIGYVSAEPKGGVNGVK